MSAADLEDWDPGHLVPGINPAALYNFGDCFSYAILAAEGGDTAKAEVYALEAAVALASAFPLSSPESGAGGVILAAVERYRAAAAAARSSSDGEQERAA